MKRIWFAVVFLLIAASLCISEQYYVKNVYTEMTEKIEEAQIYCDEKNYSKLDDSVKDIKKYWDKNNEILCTISDHGVLDDLGTELNSLDISEKDEIKKALETSKALTKIFYENQKISLANIL